MINIRNLLCILSFIGTAYHGFQIQTNAITIQQVFQDALVKTIGYLPDVKGCSRTDTGVHALEYALSFKTDSDMPTERILYALNYHLPKDISVLSVEEKDESFHARYSCIAKRYRYVMYNDRIMDPFLVDRALQIKKAIDCNSLNEAAQYFVGTHDFRPFACSKNSREDTFRTVYSCHLYREGKTVHFVVTADGFLYNMVRIMVGTLLEIHSKRLEPEDISRILETQIRIGRCVTAPAKGLYLDRVYYSPEEMNEQSS